MLYHPLRKTLTRIQTALDNFSGHTGPDFLETASPELQALLDGIDSTQSRISAYLDFMPVTCDAAPDDGDFGPVLHVEDMRLAASITVPFASTLDSTIPTESYGPVDFLAEKLTVLLGAIKIYSGWKQYTVGEQTTKWRGFERLIPTTTLSDVDLLNTEMQYLGKLFKNIAESASIAQRGVEFYLGQNADTV
jgi:hypothetical protein